MKHPGPYRVKPPFVIFDIRAIWSECPDVKSYKWLLILIPARPRQSFIGSHIEQIVLLCITLRYPISSRILRINVYLISLKPMDFINIFKKTVLLINFLLYSLSILLIIFFNILLLYLSIPQLMLSFLLFRFYHVVALNSPNGADVPLRTFSTNCIRF